jgi:hypothetical protein
MSEYFKSREKLIQGNNWRGTIDVEIDDESYEWTVRQISDDEYFDVISDIDRDSLSQFRDDIDEDKLEEFRELRDRDDLDDDEQERHDELREELEDTDILDRIDDDTFNAIRRAGMYGVVPSEDEVNHVMSLTFEEQDRLFSEHKDKVPEIVHDGNVRIQSRDVGEKVVKEDIKERLRNATDFLSFEVGMQVLKKTMDTEESEGN